MRSFRYLFLILAAAVLLLLTAGAVPAQDASDNPAHTPVKQVIIPTVLPPEDEPAEEFPQEEMIPEETPAEDLPVEEAAPEATPAEETGPEEIPAEDGSAEETMPEEAPTEEATQTKNTPVDPAALLTDENLFPLKGYTNTFYESQGYVNEVSEDGIIHQFYVYYGKATDLQMSLLPAPRSARNSNRFLNLEKSWSPEFHAAITLKRTECVPSNSCGGCWVRYSNAALKGVDSESGVILYPGDEAYAFGPSGGKIRYESIADLSELDQSEELLLEFIRVDDVSYFYADGEFLFSYADGIPGSVSFEAGSFIVEGGTRVACEFDDFTMTFKEGVYK